MLAESIVRMLKQAQRLEKAPALFMYLTDTLTRHSGVQVFLVCFCFFCIVELHSLSHTEREQLLYAVYPAEAHTLRLV